MQPWPPESKLVEEALAAAVRDGSAWKYEGEHGRRLTELLASTFETPFVSLCCSGTFAVELALRALPVGQGEVILAGYDFPGNFRAIEAVGARPVLADVDGPWTLSRESLEEAWSEETTAVLVSHMHGQLAPMRDICEWAAERGAVVIEDACQAPGGRVDGRPTGSWGDAAALSFGGSKLLTAGRGGALLTRRGDVHQRAKIFCERGNHAFPLSELQAAALVPQVAALPHWTRLRADGAERLRGLLDGAPLQWAPAPAAGDVPAYFKLGWLAPGDRRAWVSAGQSRGLLIGEGFRGFFRRSAARCRHASGLSRARRAAERTIVLHHLALLGGPAELQSLAAALRTLAAELAGENETFFRESADDSDHQ